MKPGKRYRTQNNYKPLSEPTGVPDDVLTTVMNNEGSIFNVTNGMPYHIYEEQRRRIQERAYIERYRGGGSTYDEIYHWPPPTWVGEPEPQKHTCTWKRYVGIQVEFDYCDGCNAQRKV